MSQSEIDLLRNKHTELIDIVTKRVQTDFPEDIDLIGICGSFLTDDFYEKSDLDLLVVPNNERGWGFTSCFVLDGIGYDLYGTSWKKLEKMACYDDMFVSHVIDVDIVYCRDSECMERFQQLRSQALGIINGPMTPQILQKAKTHLESAISAYGRLMLEDKLGAVRQYSGDALYHLTNAVCCMNHSYFRRGVKRQLEEMLAMEQVPDHFKEYFDGVMHARTVAEIKEATKRLLQSVNSLYDTISSELLDIAVPAKDDLRGTYEEIWSNWKNKIHYAAKHGDVLLAFATGVSCQDFYNEMQKEHGTAFIDLMEHFQADALDTFANAFEEAMELYRQEYEKLGMRVLEYRSVDAFRKDYLG